MAKYCVLYNPHAGNNNGKESAQKLKELLSGEISFHDMTKIDSYAAFFEKTPKDVSVVLCGGDGTLNRFINDTEGLSLEYEILYFAVGNGNDFLHDIGHKMGDMPVKINDYLKNLPIVTVKGRSYRVLNGVGFGIDGYCCEEGDRLRSIGRKVDYTAIAIKGLLGRFKPRNAVVTVDGKTYRFKKTWIAPTMHGRFYGGGMMPAPKQDRMNAEGTVSTLIFHGSGKLKTLMIFPSIFKGEHVTHTDVVQVLTGHDVTVEFDRPSPLQIDGETILDVTSYHMAAGETAAAGKEAAAAGAAV